MSVSDFQYISELVESFFSQAHIQRALNLIYEQEISGWEIWWQIEFANFLSMHKTEPEWYREEAIDFDMRMEKGKSFARADFVIRKKGCKQDAYIALELKQHPVYSNCIRNMMKDIIKFEKLKKSHLEIRSFWVLGVFNREKKQYVKEFVSARLEEADYEFHRSIFLNKFIPNTHYAYCIF